MKFSGSGTAVVGSWFVKEDDVVREDKVLLWYTSSGATQQLKSPYTGLVGRIVRQGGQQVATGDTLCFVKACPHYEPSMEFARRAGRTSMTIGPRTREIRRQKPSRALAMDSSVVSHVQNCDVRKRALSSSSSSV